ncbi:peptide ligase PGM1-related protein [Polymorphospora sp. NPDC050346]|uniref:preATP grasp domain-containing protein n=1 Tax=Polymorphospora sp. NPDC050346 TaxID=3155780 RepID=UPI0033F03D6E
MRLLIGNSTDIDLVGEFEKAGAAWWAQRLVWFAREGDVLVLPALPEDDYVDYVTGVLGVDRSSLRLLVPPPGTDGAARLTADRLADPSFLADLDAALAGRTVEQVLATWPAASVVALARRAGAADLLPGQAFLSQGGGALVNSKAVFRAVAAGAGVPIPQGAVCANPAGAEQEIWDLLAEDRAVIIKHEFYSGGVGNHILSRGEGIQPLGAPHVSIMPDRPAVAKFIAAEWDRYTSGGRHRLVVEEYFPGSRAVFSELLITDGGIQSGTDGEMFYVPIANAQAIPAPDQPADRMAAVTEHARRLCEPLRAMGYRGWLSADAIVTPGGAVYFTEYNGRITGSTHLHEVLGRRVVGPDFARDRVLFERVGWRAPSFRKAVDAVEAAGLAYDPATRTGALFCSAYDPDAGSVWYCAVAPDMDAIRVLEERLASLFPQQPS